MSSAATPQTSAARAGDHSRATARASSQPLVWRATNVSSTSPSRSTTCSIALSSARSVPGRTGRCRSDALRRRRAARVGADDERALGLAVADAPPEDRVAGGGVRAQQQEAVGERDVGVGRRRAVEAERAAVAGDRGGHAQARVGVDVVRAEKALGELVDRVVVLGQQLAGDVERDRVGAVLVDDRAAGVPASVPSTSSQPRRLEARVAVVAAQRHRRAVGRVRRRTAGRAACGRCARGWRGDSGSPRTPVSRPSSTSASRPQPTPQ